MAEKLGSGLQIRVGVCDSRYHLHSASDRFAISDPKGRQNGPAATGGFSLLIASRSAPEGR